MTRPEDPDDFLLSDNFIAESDEPPAGLPWYVLIVDDDESVHSISRVVLANLRFLGRPIEMLSAYSGRGAADILRKRNDIAVVLLDVVMEEEDAGLRLVREIREEIGNTALRIILRTGEPGQAPERRIIVDYDINDYKSKAELTAQKLFTSTISALRGYADIVALERSRQGLEQIICHAPALFARRSLDGFAHSLLAQVAELLGGEGDGALIVPDPTSGEPLLVAGTGGFAASIGQKAAALPAEIAERVARAINEGCNLNEQRLIIRPIHTSMQQPGVMLFRPAIMPTRDNLALVDILCASVGVGLDNVYLHRHLLDQQAALEDKVVARTHELAEANRHLLASQTQLQEELRVAGTLQQSILPTTFPVHARIHGAALMRAARSIGGDFYDIFEFDTDRIGFVVADVSGKGVPAALFMVLVRTILQEVARDGLSPAEVLAETNRRLLVRNPLSLFVTILYGVLDSRTGCFTFCSGGHGMPHLSRADGRIEQLRLRPSPLLGLLETACFTQHAVALAPGDAVVMTTDGVEEACNARDEMFGAARLRDALAHGVGDAPPVLLARVLHAIDEFTGGRLASDDLTCLVVRWDG